MAIIHSPAIKANLPRPQTHGAVHFHRFVHDLAAGFVASGNILELGYVPAFARVSGFMINPVGLVDSSTISMGILTGVVGADGSRTQGTEFAAASTAITAAINGSRFAAFDLDRVDYDRAIGVTFSADIAAAAAAGKKLALHLFYHN